MWGQPPPAVPPPSSRLIPAPQPRPPAAHVAAILVVLRPELPAQRRLLVKNDKKMDAEGNRCDRSHHSRVGVPENHPQPNPPRCEAQIHGVPYIAIETHHNQSLWRSHRSGRAASGPPEVPDAAQGNSESQH